MYIKMRQNAEKKRSSQIWSRLHISLETVRDSKACSSNLVEKGSGWGEQRGNYLEPISTQHGCPQRGKNHTAAPFLLSTARFQLRRVRRGDRLGQTRQQYFIKFRTLQIGPCVFMYHWKNKTPCDRSSTSFLNNIFFNVEFLFCLRYFVHLCLVIAAALKEYTVLGGVKLFCLFFNEINLPSW